MLNFQQYIIHQSYFIFIIPNKLQNLWGIILLLNKAIRSQDLIPINEPLHHEYSQ